MAANTVEARLSAKDDGLTKALENVTETLQTLDMTVRKIGQILLKANDQASPAIEKAQKAADKLDQASPEVAMEAHDKVTQAAKQAADAANSIPEETMTAMEAANHVTTAANQATDSVDSIPERADVALEADDHISSICEQVKAKLGEVETKAEQTSAGVKNAFQFGAGSAAAQKAIGIVASGFQSLTTGAVDVGKSFQASMSNVAALSKNLPGSEEFSQLSAAAKQAGETTQFSASEAADALGFMALAGWDSQKSIDALPSVLNLAAASGMGLAEASDTVTDYMSAFSNSLNGAGTAALGSAEMVDIMAYAQANSNTSAAQLGEAWKNCAANLNAAGQDVQTTTSFLEAMANQGLKGSEAGTAMAAIMRDVTAQMENGSIKIGDTAVAVQDAEGNFRDLTEIMTDVEKATQGMGDAEKAAALSATFTADSQKGVNLLMNEGMGKVAGYEAALRSCDGAAEDMANTMNDNLAGDLKSLNSAWEAVQTSIFEKAEPALRGITQTMTDVVRWVNQLIGGWDAWQAHLNGTATKEQEEQLQGLSGTMKAIYQVIQNVKSAWEKFKEGFQASGAFEAVKQAVETVKGAFFGLSKTMADGSGAKSFGEAIGSAVKWIAQIIEKIAGFEAKSGGLLAKLTGCAAGVKMFGGAFGKLGPMASAGMAKVKGVLNIKLTNPFKKMPAEAGSSMDKTRSKVAQCISAVGDIFKKAGEGIAVILEKANPAAILSFGAAFTLVGAGMALMGDQAEGIRVVLDALGDSISQIVGAIGQTLVPIIQIVCDSFVEIVAVISDAVVQIVQALGPWIDSITGMITSLGGVFERLVEIVGNTIIGVVQALAPFMPEISDMVSTVGSCIDSICQAFQKLVEEIPPILEQLNTIIETIFEGIGTVFEKFGEACQRVGDGIKSAFEGVGTIIEKFGEAVRNVLDGVSGIIESIGNACLNAGNGFKKLAEGLEIITRLNGWDLAGSLAAAAAGIGSIAAACSGIGDSGNQMMQMGQGLILIASAASQAASGAASFEMLAVSVSSVTGMGASIMNEASLMSAAMSVMSASVVSGMASVASAMLTGSHACLAAAGKIGSGCKDAIVSGISQAARSASSSMGSLCAVFASSCALIVTSVSGSMTAVAKAIQTELRSVPPYVKTVVSQIVSALRSGQSACTSAGRSAGSGYANGLRGGLSSAVSFALSSASSVASALRTGNSQAYDSGRWIAQGFAQGIRDHAELAIAQARAMAKNVNAEIQKTSKIGSPSKIQIQNGKWIAQGLALGMESMESTVRKSASSLIRLAKPEQTEFRLESAALEETGRDVVIEVHQDIDGREFARAMYRFNKAEFDKAQHIELQLTGG